MWISPRFQLLLVREFQRIKADENDRLKFEWNLQRTLAKVNYHIHTDAIKEKLIPKELSKQQVSFVYANEADLLNVALFGVTAKQWREANPNADGNVRGEASIEQKHQCCAYPPRIRSTRKIDPAQQKCHNTNEIIGE
jgi:hypothetical protein